MPVVNRSFGLKNNGLMSFISRATNFLFLVGSEATSFALQSQINCHHDAMCSIGLKFCYGLGMMLLSYCCVRSVGSR